MIGKLRWVPTCFLFAFCVWLLGASPARAVFIKSQMDLIDPEVLFDSEYFLDLLSFSNPLEWVSLWEGSAAGYRITGASLDCCDLYLRQDLRFPRALTQSMDFQYRLTQLEDKDRQDLHQWVELRQRLAWGSSAITIFGEPTFRKEDSDIGLALSYRPAESLSLALRRNWVDFNFNQRGSTTQRYTQKPLTDELFLQFARGARRFTAYLELDHPLRRKVPDEDRSYAYRRSTIQLGFSDAAPDSWERRLEYTYEFQKEGDLFDPDPANASVDFRRQVHRLWVAAQIHLSPGNRLEVGQVLMLRKARRDNPLLSDQGVVYRRWELQPHARWRRTVTSWMGTELAAYLVVGENRRRFPGQMRASMGEDLLEIKMGSGVDFTFSRRSHIGIYGTFDLDDAGHLWDGGSVRAMFLF